MPSGKVTTKTYCTGCDFTQMVECTIAHLTTPTLFNLICKEKKLVILLYRTIAGFPLNYRHTGHILINIYVYCVGKSIKNTQTYPGNETLVRQMPEIYGLVILETRRLKETFSFLEYRIANIVMPIE